MLIVFWKKYQRIIVWRLFVPYLFYLVVSFEYLVRILNNEAYEMTPGNEVFKKTIGVVNCILIVYLLHGEVY